MTFFRPTRAIYKIFAGVNNSVNVDDDTRIVKTVVNLVKQ